MDTEIKVGIFVSLGVGLVLAAILILGATENMLARKKYTARFLSVEGMIEGAKVMVGGLNVGTVEKIEFDPAQHNIQVKFSIVRTSTDWVRKDSFAEIATQGVLGDKYLSVSSGDSAEPILPNGSEIPSKSGEGISQFLTKGDKLMNSLNSIAGSMDRMLKGFESGNRSEIFFQGLASTAKNLASATDKINRELEEMKLHTAVNHLNGILEKIDNGTGTLGALVNDPGLYDDAKALLGGANRNRIIRNLVRQTIKDSDNAPAPEQLVPVPNPTPAKK